jgi:hypothetical protein
MGSVSQTCTQRDTTLNMATDKSRYAEAADQTLQFEYHFPAHNTLGENYLLSETLKSHERLSTLQ